MSWRCVVIVFLHLVLAYRFDVLNLEAFLAGGQRGKVLPVGICMPVNTKRVIDLLLIHAKEMT